MPEAQRELPVVRDRGSPFSYECRACRRCCHDKRIQLNPYELTRLSRYLGCTTTDVIARFTVNGGTALASRGDGSCVFLSDSGCEVHSARPLVCRLYPLGRLALGDGREAFVEHTPHPESAGIYGCEKTVADFLASQDVEPYLAAAERYYAILQLLLAPSVSVDASPSVPQSAEVVYDAENFVDADGAVARVRGASVVPGRLSAEELTEAHLGLLTEWARQLAPVLPNAELHDRSGT